MTLNPKNFGEAALLALPGAAIFIAALYFRSDIASHIGETPTSMLMSGLSFFLCWLPFATVIARYFDRREREREAKDKQPEGRGEREGKT